MRSIVEDDMLISASEESVFSAVERWAKVQISKAQIFTSSSGILVVSEVSADNQSTEEADENTAETQGTKTDKSTQTNECSSSVLESRVGATRLHQHHVRTLGYDAVKEAAVAIDGVLSAVRFPQLPIRFL